MKPTAAQVSPLFFICFFLLPSLACAQVQITEVMYDAPGSDSGHEWIEIVNTDGAVNLSGYKFSEGGTNHGLSVAAGTSTLAAGEVAIISNNPQTFLQGFPTYSGTIFKSSFSLSNTGETLTLKDSKLAPIDSVTYDSTMGASGDGNSLHKSGDVWVAGMPNPGSTALTAAITITKTTSVAPPASKKSALVASSKSKVLTAIVHNTAAVAESAANTAQPMVPSENPLLWTVLGLAALVMFGIAGALYVRASVPTPGQETTLTAEEFTIET